MRAVILASSGVRPPVGSLEITQHSPTTNMEGPLFQACATIKHTIKHTIMHTIALNMDAEGSDRTILGHADATRIRSGRACRLWDGGSSELNEPDAFDIGSSNYLVVPEDRELRNVRLEDLPHLSAHRGRRENHDAPTGV